MTTNTTRSPGRFATVLVAAALCGAGCAGGAGGGGGPTDGVAPSVTPLPVGPEATGLGLPPAVEAALDGFLAVPGPDPCSVRITVPNEEIGFGQDSAAIGPDGMAAIAAMAAALVPASRIDVVGHTSTEGAAAHNQDLSERRATAVATTIQGFLPAGWAGLIEPRGAGENEPAVSPERTGEDRRRNRRVEITPTYPPDVCATGAEAEEGV
jgi:outer membrane protein OmpA-like peptidoglycan-associated protein